MRKLCILIVLLLLPCVGLVQAKPYSEEATLYKYEKEYGKRVLPVLRKLGAGRLFSKPYRKGRDAALPHSWELGGKSGDSDWRKKTHIVFEGIDYSGGTQVEGVSQNYDLPDEGRGWSQIYRAGAIPIDQVVNESITLNESVQESYTAEASFEVTNRTSVKAEASLGDIAGASAESETTTTAKASFGTSGGHTKVTTYTHAVATTVHIPVGQAVMVSVDVSKRKVVTPITERGFIEASMKWDLYDWADNRSSYLRGGKDAKKNRIYFDSFQSLLWFLEGQRMAEYPGMKNFLSDMRKLAAKGDREATGALAFYKWIQNKDSRRVELEKERVRIYESAGEVRNEFVR